ncbi:MAG: NRDE family protein, partial [Woeseiales bacterium]
MCLVVFAWQVHPKFPLVIAANRDELHSRPTQALHWWADEPTLLGGRDLQAGGTWFSVARNGRIATVTNYRESHTRQSSRRSRGELVTQFLTGEKSPNDYASNIPIDNYAGFNLLVADQNELCYLSNRGDAPKTLEPGIYGLSNASL